MLGNKKKFIYTFSLLLITIIYFDSFFYLITSWIKNSYYQHSFFILVLYALLFYRNQHKKETPDQKQPPKKAILLTFLLALMLFLYGVQIQFIYLQLISSLFIISSFTLLLYPHHQHQLFHFLFLIFLLIPMPYIYDLTVLLQKTNSQCSAQILSLLGMPVSFNEYNVLIKDQKFVIGEASSGIRSFLFFPALYWTLTLTFPTKTWQQLVGSFICLMITQFTNWLRLTSMFSLAVVIGVWRSYDAFHPYFNLVFYFFNFILLWFLLKWFHAKNNHHSSIH